MDTPTTEIPKQIGRYKVLRPLGRGGMGVVYLAHDDKLDRDIALKMISGSLDDSAIKRFWREARAAASVSHPNVCQIYEVDESPFGVFIAMELLEGQSLEMRLQAGPCPANDAVRIGLEMLAALMALHERGFVHRDVKPSNVFLTSHGAKLLDFGLARSSASDETVQIGARNAQDITQPGMLIGTPRYMAPEQINGAAADARTDVYAAGAVLFEMLAGRPAFVGGNIVDLVHAVIHEKPPALQGSPAVIAIDRVIRRALSKDPSGRYDSAGSMMKELKAVPEDTSGAGAMPVRALTRLLVPPLQLLNSDPDSAFLSFSLAEAISSSLAGLKDVVVRSPSVAKNASQADPRRLAAEADVDLLVLGSLVRSGEQLRANLQLGEAGTGTVLGAVSARGRMDDIFGLEDQLTTAVAQMLAPRRQTAAEETPRRDVPATAKAFEFFLRGNEFMRRFQLHHARAAYEAATSDDPAFAPAWAGLGRSYRVIGKYIEDRLPNERRAEEAFRRSLALSPDQPMAHRYLTHLESEQGRADAAIGRLLEYAKMNRNDAQLFAGLVHACRYSGMLEESMAAHAEAKRLDPTIGTSVEYTLVMLGQYDRLKAMGKEPSADLGAVFYGRALCGEGVRRKEIETHFNFAQLPTAYRLTLEAFVAVATDSREDALKAIDTNAAFHSDPEALFIMGILAAERLKDSLRSLRLLEAGVRGGFTPVSTLETSPQLDSVRDTTEFATLVELSKQRRKVAEAVFNRGGGR